MTKEALDLAFDEFLEGLSNDAWAELSIRALLKQAFVAGAAVPQTNGSLFAPAPAQGPIARVWEAHLIARSAYFRRKNGFPPSHTPKLTPELRKMIAFAVRRHGPDVARAAGIGIFLSKFHTGKEGDETREFLTPDLVWKVRAATGQDNVERFAELYFARKDEIDGAIDVEAGRRKTNLLADSTEEKP